MYEYKIWKITLNCLEQQMVYELNAIVCIINNVC